MATNEDIIKLAKDALESNFKTMQNLGKLMDQIDAILPESEKKTLDKTKEQLNKALEEFKNINILNA